MLRALSIGATGLRTNQEAVDVIGNNIANIDTTGAKGHSGEFADLLAKNSGPRKASRWPFQSAGRAVRPEAVGRVTRGKLREMERTLIDLEQEMSRPPSDSEAAARLGISIDNYHGLLSQARAAMTLSLEWVESEGDDGEPVTRAWIPDPATKDPLASLMDKDSVGRLAALVAALSPAQQLVLHLHYIEELNFRAIGMVMDISESRATQLHTAAVLALRGQVKTGRLQPAAGPR